MEHRVAYTKAVLGLGPGASSKLVERTIQELFETRQKDCEKSGLPLEQLPGTSSVYRWCKKVIEAGYFFAALAITEHRNQARKKRIHPVVEQIIYKVIDEYYLVGVKSTKGDVINITTTWIEEENLLRQKENKSLLICPNQKTIIRRISALSPIDVATARKGKRYSENKYNYGKKIKYGSYIGSRVEGDTQYVDCLIYDPILDITYRPELLVFIDCHTKCIVGYELSYLPKSSEKVVRALADMMSDNNSIYGCIPNYVVVDNGPEFINQSLHTIYKTLGFTLDLPPAYTPNAKPHVERFFGTLNSMFSHKTPGTTFEHVIARGYYKSEEFAIYTLVELKKLIDQAFEAYHTTEHKSLSCSPDTAWKLALENMTPRRLDPGIVLASGSKVVFRKVNKGRVSAVNLQWHSPVLPELGDAVKARGEQVTVAYCPSDLTNAYVWDPRDPTNIIICEPVNPELQTGLTLEMYDAMRRDLKEIDFTSGNPERARKLRAELTIKLLEDAKKSANKTKKKRARMAQAAKQEMERQAEQLWGTEEDPYPVHDDISSTDHDSHSNAADDDFQLI